MTETMKPGSITDRIRAYIEKNSRCSASPQAINRAMELNISASTMHRKITWLRDNGYICEVKGRYYYWDQLPKELEKFI